MIVLGSSGSTISHRRRDEFENTTHLVFYDFRMQDETLHVLPETR
jgi:hypothetical protein